MLQMLVLLTLIAGALVVAAESPAERQQWLDRGAAMVGTVVQQMRMASTGLMERTQVAGGAGDPFAKLREQGVVTDTFGADRDNRAGSARPAVSSPAPAHGNVERWPKDYEDTKRSLFDALHRLEGSIREK